MSWRQPVGIRQSNVLDGLQRVLEPNEIASSWWNATICLECFLGESARQASSAHSCKAVHAKFKKIEEWGQSFTIFGTPVRGRGNTSQRDESLEKIRRGKKIELKAE